MTDRPVYVYRLVIAYPPGSKEPGWKPACWGEMLRAVRDKAERRKLRDRGFRWPREHLYLSHSGAWQRAALLTWLGAVVDVQRSGEVTWWQDTDAMDWWPSPESIEQGTEPLDAVKRWADASTSIITDVREEMAEIYRNQAQLYATYSEQAALLDSSQDTR